MPQPDVMFSSGEIKSNVINLGADKCGIASTDRFSSAPTGFHPTDVYSKCKSVVVFLKRMPPEVIMAENPVPYSHWTGNSGQEYPIDQ